MASLRTQTQGSPARRAILLAGVSAVAIAVAATRRPGAVRNPQFWAEDGVRWYAEAHNLGPWTATWLPDAGYLQLLPRLVAALAVQLPVAYGPAIFEAAALAILVLPVVLLISPRWDAVLPGTWPRLIAAGIYIGLPNTYETEGNLTNAQWRLALAVFVLLLGAVPRRPLGRVLDVFLVALCGLSGPFCLLLLPIAGWSWFRDRSGWRLVRAGILACGAAVQTVVLITTSSSARKGAPLDPSLERFFRIVGGQVVLSTLVGLNNFKHVVASMPWGTPAAAALVALAAIAVGYAAWKGPPFLRALDAIALAALLGGLATPKLSSTMPQWPTMAAVPGAGNRYYFLPALALALSIAWLALTTRSRVVRAPAIVFFGVLIAVGVPTDWRLPPYTDYQYQSYAGSYARLAPGGSIAIPINPPGWVMCLRKPLVQGGTGPPAPPPPKAGPADVGC